MGFSARPGIFNKLLAVIYGADGSDIAFNLFPSYHCLISFYCYSGVGKQHYILDVAGGIGIAVICYLIVNKWDPGREFQN